VSMLEGLIRPKMAKARGSEMRWNPGHLWRWLREPHIKPSRSAGLAVRLV
jgi:hypothetical protein